MYCLPWVEVLISSKLWMFDASLEEEVPRKISSSFLLSVLKLNHSQKIGMVMNSSDSFVIYRCSWGPQVHNVQYHSQNFEWAFNIKCSAVVLYLMFVVFHNQSPLITKVCLNRWFGKGTFSLSLFFLSLKHQLRHNVKGQIWFQVKFF